MYSPLGLVIFVAVEGTFVRFTKGHDHFISNYIRCGCLRKNQCNIACKYAMYYHVDYWSPGGRVTNAVGTIFRKIFVGTRARPI